MSLNGTIVTIASGPYRASIATSGGTLVSLTKFGRDMVLPFDPDGGVGVAFQGRTLLPWPNRITGSRYEFDGQTYEVPCNEPASGAANHGLATWLPWTLTKVEPHAATLKLDMPASAGYPFDIVAQMQFLVSEAGLAVEVEIANTGSGPAPVGAGFHPYLTCDGAELDNCTAHLPASTVLEVNEVCAPDRLSSVEGSPYDLRDPRSLRDTRIDNVFTDWPDGAKEWTFALSHAGTGTVSLSSDAPWVQLYTAELLDRRGIACEPMTCSVDAFNGPDREVRLAPGAVRSLRYRVGADWSNAQ